MKKFLSLFLAIIMAVTVLKGITVSATTIVDSGKCGDNITWTLDSGGLLTISGTGNMYDYNSSVAIPWHNYMRSVKTVVIESGVNSISDYAFAGFGLLTNITIGNSVTNIGDYAFAACLFTDLIIPNSVVSIGDGAFSECSSLRSITIPYSVISIGNEAFGYCSSLKNIQIDNGIKNIGDEAFKSCSSLSNITIPNSVTNMGKGIFNSCSALTDVILGNGITCIKQSSFLLCSSLTEITIPNSVINIDQMAFYLCGRLIYVNYYGSETQWKNISIGDYNEELLNANVHFNPSITDEPSEQIFDISGSVKQFGNGNTTIELLKDDAVVGTKNVTTSYAFEDIAEGEYTVRVSASKHATREYEVTVSDSNITQDVVIWLYGDVTKDGVVNNNDAIQINRKNNNMTSVFTQTTDADYREKVANVTAITGTDTVVNNADVMQINRKINNMSSVFDRLA